MRATRNLIIVTLLTACTVGCRRDATREPAVDAAANDRWRATDEAVVDTLTKGIAGSKPESRFGVTHVVLCWLKKPGDADQRRQLIETAHGFAAIPGVSLIAAGTALPSTRPVVDSSFDVAFVMMFENETALHAYDEHPIHRQAVETLLRPLTQKILVYDFRNIRP